MRAPKQCGSYGCDVLVTAVTYCATHEAQRQAMMTDKRGNFRQRGYDNKHDVEGALAKARAIRLRLPCPRCGQPILAGPPLDYGHTVARVIDPTSRADRVEHSHCNRSANPKAMG